MNETLSLTPFAVTMLIGTVIPILVGLITKQVTSSKLQSVLLLAASAIQGLIVSATMADGSAVISAQSVVTAGLGFITAVASYYGFLKPSGISPAVNSRTANFGLGSGK